MLNKEVTWNNSLTKMSWRVDSKAKSRKQADLNELTSIVELVLKEKGNQDSNVRVSSVCQLSQYSLFCQLTLFR